MKTNPAPLISVVIPVYNGEPFIREALQSVFAQDYRPFEVIVVDDGSTDGTVEVVRAFPEVRFYQQERSGPGAARNYGISKATGSLFGFLDADDVWLREKLSAQVEVLQAQPELEAVYTHAIQFQDGAEVSLEKMTAMPGLLPGTLLIRREAFFRVGLFAEMAGEKEAFDWHSRAVDAGLRYHLLPEVYYRRRIHSTNRGILERDPQGYVSALKRSLDRRREKTGE